MECILSEQKSNSSNFTIVPDDGFLAVGQASGENFTAPARPRMSESYPIIGLLLLSTKNTLILPFCSTTENDFLCAPSSYKMSEHILIRQILHHNFCVSLSQIVK